MTTRLDKTIKRELDLGGERYMVSVGPEGVKIVLKGRRKGREISWEALLSGEVELGRDLAMSLEVYQALDPTERDTS
ncbi:MAG: hypothetical protein H0T58_00950 [Gemmatimonadales bacterium]|nr:hypothetical protein [Gemmatimonadales bacterium]